MQRIFARPEILGFALLLLLAPAFLSATLITVNANGGADYTTLSGAMRMCADGDSILVYPGTYYGEESFYNKSLYVYSLAIATGDTSYVAQTILDGQLQGGIVKIQNCAQAYLGGFTIQRGTGYRLIGWAGLYGGGIFIRDSQATIEHCRITRNLADCGGGINIIDADVQLKGNVVTLNATTNAGGGITMGYFTAGGTSTVIFSTTDLNSVYCNSAGEWGNDFAIINYSADTLPQIYLQKFTVSQQELTRNRVYYVYEVECPQASIAFSEAAVTPVARDLYVSPNGNNANSGLSPDEPMQSISWALAKIQADSLNPRTIYIADGTYSISATGELFPLHAKHYVSLIGEGMPILDGENHASLISCWNWPDYGLHPYGDLTVRNLQLQNNASHLMEDISITGLNEVVIENLRCVASNHSYISHFLVQNCNSATIRNIDIQAGSRGEACMGVGMLTVGEISNVKLQNAVSLLGYVFDGSIDPSTITLSNCVFDHAYLPEGNMGASALQVSGAAYANDPSHFQFKAVNCTIAHDQIPAGYYNGDVRITDCVNAEFYNCIISNNDPNSIACNWQYSPGYALFSHCLIQNGTDDFVVYGDLGSYDTDHILTGDPMFVDNPDSLDYLSANSPCIDAGTTDIPGYTFPATDLAGNPRIYGSTVDLGAYEYNPTATNDVTQPEPLRVNCYPNPIQLSKRSGNYCTLSFAVPKPGKVEVTLYNIRGQLVKRLVDAHMTTGQCDLRWDGTNESGATVGTGVYLYRVKAGDHEQEGRITVVK